MTLDQTKNLWPERTAAFLSDEKGQHLICRELLRQNSWQLMSAPNDANQITKLRHENKISAIIVVDSPNQPATEALRVLFKDSRVRLTPTLVICGDLSNADAIIYEKIFQVFTSPKPLTPSTFHQSFRQMISHWSHPALFALRKVADAPDEPNLNQKIDILERLLASPHSMPIALCGLMQLMTSAGMYKEAEQKLLDHSRIHFQNPAMLAYCAWFYLSRNMPSQASKLLAKLKTISPTSVLLNPDIASAHLALGEVGQACDAVYEWHRRHPGSLAAEEALAKLLVADGRAQNFESFGVSKSTILKVQQQWALAENQILSKANIRPGERNAS